jgi:hypothetical protein
LSRLRPNDPEDAFFYNALSVLKPRNRLVYFRITEDEFQRFHRMCGPSGARSLSHLARAALERMLNEENPQLDRELSHKLQSLDRLSRLLGGANRAQEGSRQK